MFFTLVVGQASGSQEVCSVVTDGVGDKRLGTGFIWKPGPLVPLVPGAGGVLRPITVTMLPPQPPACVSPGSPV